MNNFQYHGQANLTQKIVIFTSSQPFLNSVHKEKNINHNFASTQTEHTVANSDF